jgi:hypothetical protein
MNPACFSSVTVLRLAALDSDSASEDNPQVVFSRSLASYLRIEEQELRASAQGRPKAALLALA